MNTPRPPKRGWWRSAIAALAVLALLGGLTAWLLLSPMKAWFAQDTDRAKRQLELDELRDANAGLEAEIARLETDGGIISSIREQLGYVRPGEELLVAQDDPAASMRLPGGWPFDTVEAILRLRKPAD